MKILTINAIAVVVVLIGFELWLHTDWRSSDKRDRPKSRIENLFDRGFGVSDPELGVVLTPGIVRDGVKKYYGDTLVYDVTYTINQRGWRVTGTESLPDDVRSCVIFFGGSFTFGDGVDDHESTPGRVAALLDGSYRVFNFGFQGYGAHEMLGALESGRVPTADECSGDTHVFYTFINDHVKRAARFRKYSHGPRYQPVGDYDVKRVGLLSERRIWIDWIDDFEIVRRLVYGKVWQRDVDRMLGILNRSRSLVESRYPRATFSVLAWSKLVAHGHDYAREFSRIGIEPVPLLEYLTDGENLQDPDFWKIPHDGHPNAAAHATVAELVVDRVKAFEGH